MDRIFTLLVLFIGLNTTLSAQCEIPNGSFEDWVDLTLVFDTTGTLQPETVLVPENFSSAFRLLFAAFDQLLGGVTDQELAGDYLGIERSEDASDGNYSMKIGGNGVYPLADALSTFECDGELPARFAMDINHVGNVADTLNLIMTLGENTIIPQTQQDLLATSGYYNASLTVDQTTGWSTIEADINDNANGIPADSVFIWLIASTNEEALANGEESYFLIDNMRFMNESGVSHKELAAPVKVFPMPFDDHINIQNDNAKLQAEVFDLQGRLVKSFTVEPGASKSDMQHLGPSGNYILQLSSEDKEEHSTYNIIKK